MREYEFDVCPKCGQELDKNHPLLRPETMKIPKPLKLAAIGIAVVVIAYIVFLALAVSSVFERIG